MVNHITEEEREQVLAYKQLLRTVKADYLHYLPKKYLSEKQPFFNEWTVLIGVVVLLSITTLYFYQNTSQLFIGFFLAIVAVLMIYRNPSIKDSYLIVRAIKINIAKDQADLYVIKCLAKKRISIYNIKEIQAKLDKEKKDNIAATQTMIDRFDGFTKDEERKCLEEVQSVLSKNKQ